MVGRCSSTFCIVQTTAILLVPCTRILCFFLFLPLHLGLSWKSRREANKEGGQKDSDPGIPHHSDFLKSFESDPNFKRLVETILKSNQFLLPAEKSVQLKPPF